MILHLFPPHPDPLPREGENPNTLERIEVRIKLICITYILADKKIKENGT